MKEIITIYVIYIIEFLIAYIYFSQIFEKKSSNTVLFTVGLVFYLISGTLNVFFKDNIFINAFSFLLINVLFSYLTYSIKFKSALFHSIILFAVMGVSEFVSLYLISAIYNSSLEKCKTNFTFYIIGGIFCKALYLLICLIISRFAQKEDNSNSTKFSFSLVIYPVCVMAVLLLLYSITLFLDDNNIKFNTIISTVSFLLLISVIFIIIYYENSLKKEKELTELQNEFQRKEIDETYLSILEHQNNELQILVHDTKNHLSIIKNLSDNNEVNNYVDNIFNDIKKYTIIGNTNNKILDLILSKYQALCNINNINFEITFNLANLNYINNSDLSTLLNNMLDNAVEAAKNSKKRKINFEIKHVKDMDVINIVNSCDFEPKVKNLDLMTTKANKNIHGYGTKSIKRIAAKYNGEYEWNYNSDDNTFHSTIIFNNR